MAALKNTAFAIVLVMMVSIFLQFQPEDVEGITPTHSFHPVSLAIDKVDEWVEQGWNGFPPMDASSLVMKYVRESDGEELPTRTDPIPVDWDLVATNVNSRIYVENGLTVSTADIDAISEVFDDTIYPIATYWFNPDIPYDVIDIRIYDFGDGPGNVGGFFYPSMSYLNDLFVDSEDLEYSRDWSFEIVAHEFQHLIHFDLDSNEELWINEGLADLSARVCMGPDQGGVQNHIDAYELYPENDLLLWNEGQPPDYYETIADYGRAFAFVSYLAYHYGGRDLIIDILSDQRNGFSSINGEMAEDGLADRVGDILVKEKVANFLDDPDYGGGIYEQGLINISIGMDHQAWTYPDSHIIDSSVRYSGYGLKYNQGSSNLAISVNSDDPVDVTLVGLNGTDIVSSVNLSNGGSGTILYQLSGFDTQYSTLLVIPHTSTSGAVIEVDVEISDLVPPVTDVLVSPTEPDGENGYYVNSPGIQLTTSEGSRIRYAWNMEDFSDYSSALHPPEGENVLKFYAQGPLGLMEDIREMTFRLDTVDPDLDIELTPHSPDGSNDYYISQPTVYLTSDEPDGEIFFDIGEGEEVYDDPFVLDSGIWDLEAYSVDPSGRRSSIQTMILRVDLSDPEISIEMDPRMPDGSSGYYNTIPEISFDPETGSTGIFTINNGPEMEYTGPFELEDGEYEIDYFARNPSGRTGTINTIFVKIDSSIPVLGHEFDPPLCIGWCDKPTYLSLIVDDPLSDIYFKMDNEGPFTYSSEILLNDGEYDLEYWAIDPAGNRRDGEKIFVRIDTTTPNTEIVLDSLPDNGFWYYDEQPSITFNTISRTVSPEITYFSLDGEEFNVYSDQMISLLPGRNTIYYYTIDEAGNNEKIKTRDIGIDLSTPEGVLKANRSLIPVRGPVMFSIADSTDDNEIYRFRMDFGDGTETGWVYDDSIEHFYSELGTYNAILTVEDSAGRQDTRDVSLKIEVLTQKEYDERMEDGISPVVLVLLIILGLILIAGIISVIAVVLIKRNRDEVEDVEWVEDVK